MEVDNAPSKLIGVCYGLTQAEVDRVRYEIEHRVGQIEVRTFEIKPNTQPPKCYRLFVRTNDWPKLENHVAQIYDLNRPFADQVHEYELKIASLIREMHASGSLLYDVKARSPMYELCLHLEWKTGWCFFSDLELRKLLDVWCDGYCPKTAHWIGDDHLEMSGTCWVGRGSDASEAEGPFHARFRVDCKTGQLSEHFLAYADAAKMTEGRVMSSKLPDLTEYSRGNYRLKIQKGDQSKSPQFAFEIEKNLRR